MLASELYHHFSKRFCNDIYMLTTVQNTEDLPIKTGSLKFIYFQTFIVYGYKITKDLKHHLTITVTTDNRHKNNFLGKY